MPETEMTPSTPTPFDKVPPIAENGMAGSSTALNR